jgi:hypothetical protein
LINSQYPIEGVVHIAIFMNESGLIDFSEILQTLGDFDIENEIDLQKIHSFQGPIPLYSELLRKYLSEFVSAHPHDSLLYLKLLYKDPMALAKTLEALIAGYDLIPIYFDYTSKSQKNFEILKNMFDGNILAAVMNSLLGTIKQGNKGLEIQTVRILEELSRSEDILNIILLRECENILSYRDLYVKQKNFIDKTDSNYDSYLNQFLSKWAKRSFAASDNNFAFKMIKELKRIKGIFKTHYQNKDAKKALDMFEEKNLYITN